MYFPTTRKWTQREMIPKPINRGISPTPLGMIISCHVAKSICVFFPQVLNLRTNGESFCAMCFCCNENRDRFKKGTKPIREVSSFLKPDFFWLVNTSLMDLPKTKGGNTKVLLWWICLPGVCFFFSLILEDDPSDYFSQLLSPKKT